MFSCPTRPAFPYAAPCRIGAGHEPLWCGGDAGGGKGRSQRSARMGGFGRTRLVSGQATPMHHANVPKDGGEADPPFALVLALCGARQKAQALSPRDCFSLLRGENAATCGPFFTEPFTPASRSWPDNPKAAARHEALAGPSSSIHTARRARLLVRLRADRPLFRRAQNCAWNPSNKYCGCSITAPDGCSACGAVSVWITIDGNSARLRWIVNHIEQHSQYKTATATAIWR